MDVRYVAVTDRIRHVVVTDRIRHVVVTDHIRHVVVTEIRVKFVTSRSESVFAQPAP